MADNGWLIGWLCHACLQDIPRGGDHNAQRTIYLWGVNFSHLRDVIESEMIKTSLNLWVRWATQWRLASDGSQPRADGLESGA